MYATLSTEFNFSKTKSPNSEVEISLEILPLVIAKSSISFTIFSTVEVATGRFSKARSIPFYSFCLSKGCRRLSRFKTINGFSSICS